MGNVRFVGFGGNGYKRNGTYPGPNKEGQTPIEELLTDTMGGNSGLRELAVALFALGVGTLDHAADFGAEHTIFGNGSKDSDQYSDEELTDLISSTGDCPEPVVIILTGSWVQPRLVASLEANKLLPVQPTYALSASEIAQENIGVTQLSGIPGKVVVVVSVEHELVTDEGYDELGISTICVAIQAAQTGKPGDLVSIRQVID